MKLSDLPKYPKDAIPRARNLRNNMTEAEWRLWGHIRNKQLGVQFKRQVPIGKYIIDFFSLEIGLVIEVDGSQHFGDEHIITDKRRTKYLEKFGLKVVRYNNLEIFENIDGVIVDLAYTISKIIKTDSKNSLNSSFILLSFEEDKGCLPQVEGDLEGVNNIHFN